MQEQDAELADIISQMRVERGRTGGFDDSRLREKVEVLGPELSLDALRQAVATSVIDRLGVTWDERFGELEAYKAEHGDCDVPTRWSENLELATWTDNQRSKHKRGQLSVDRVNRLEEIGFAWDQRGVLWRNMFSELRAYKAVHEDCDVPPKWPENPELGTWVSTQRTNKRNGKLSGERQQMLEALGFDWDPHSTQWETMFTALKSYKASDDDCNVPIGWPENPQLATWVSTQRTHYKRGTLEADRVERLEDLGFDWHPKRTAWEAMFSMLEAYKNDHDGDCNVPAHWPENPQLGRWLNKQRTLFGMGKLAAEKVTRLEDLGLVWDLHKTHWEAMFSALVAYKAVHQNCNVPTRWTENPKLANWVGTQRTIAKKGKLPDD